MNTLLFCLWGAFYILNVGLGFISATNIIVKIAMIIVALATFVPGVLLLIQGFQKKNRKLIRTIRWISLGSLGLTTLCLVALLLCTAFAAQTAALIVSILLCIVSAPMFSGQYWIISLFAWAALLSATFLKTPDRK